MNKQTERESFRSRWGFILACIGSAVGMGNIWMFPARVSKYGGGSFILPYLLFVVLLASSGMIGEMTFGRATRSGPVGAFGKAGETKKCRRLGEAIGLIPVLGSLAMAIGYSVVMGWILKYACESLVGATLSPDGGDFGAAFGGMASAFGNNIWQSAAVIGTFLILFFGISRGIENANKFMMPLFYVLFVGLGIYIAFQPGSAEGYKYLFRIEPEALLDYKTWLYALGQAFFSLSIAGNGTVIYGSYLSDKEDIPAAARRVALFDTLAALLAALVIIPAMALTASHGGDALKQGGPGLMFIHLPQLFGSIPLGALICAVFFIAVLFAGLTSLINLYEAPIATLQEKFNLSRRNACLIVGGIGLGASLLIQGIVSDWMDFLSIYVCPLGALLAAIMLFWVFGKKFVREEVEKGAKKPIGKWFYPLSKYVFCLICILVLVAGILLGGIG